MTDEAELTPEAEEREEELIEEAASEQADEQADELEAALDLDSVETDPALAQRVKDGTVTETDIITKARSVLYEKLGTLSARDLATIYVTGLRVEEMRLKAKLKAAPDAEGVKGLRAKAARAFRGQHVNLDDD